MFNFFITYQRMHCYIASNLYTKTLTPYPAKVENMVSS